MEYTTTPSFPSKLGKCAVDAMSCVASSTNCDFKSDQGQQIGDQPQLIVIKNLPEVVVNVHGICLQIF